MPSAEVPPGEARPNDPGVLANVPRPLLRARLGPAGDHTEPPSGRETPLTRKRPGLVGPLRKPSYSRRWATEAGKLGRRSKYVQTMGLRERPDRLIFASPARGCHPLPAFMSHGLHVMRGPKLHVEALICAATCETAPWPPPGVYYGAGISDSVILAATSARDH